MIPLRPGAKRASRWAAERHARISGSGVVVNPATVARTPAFEIVIWPISREDEARGRAQVRISRGFASHTLERAADGRWSWTWRGDYGRTSAAPDPTPRAEDLAILRAYIEREARGWMRQPGDEPCGDCGRRVFWCESCDDWHHVEGGPCWLHRSRCAAGG